MVHQSAVGLTSGSSFWASRPGYKPVLLLIALICFVGLVLVPVPESMIDLMSKEKPPGYSLSPGTKTITDNVNKKLNPAQILPAR